jgi:hypothetical protein
MSSGNGRRDGFNADERASRRTDGVVTLGGVAYHPVKLTNAKLRKVRRISREAMREGRELEPTTEEYKRAYDDAIAEGKDEKEAERIARREAQFSDEVDELNGRSIASQLQLLLVDDAMQPPSDEVIQRHVDEDLDSRDQVALLEYLTGEDPLSESAPERSSTPSATT